MTSGRKRARAMFITALGALAAIPVAVVGIREGVRFLRESRAIEALRSAKPAEREAALEELAELRSVRGVSQILSTVSSVDFTKPPTFHFRLDAAWEDRCFEAMGRIGGAAVPALRSKLESWNPGERVHALRFLWRVPELAGEGSGPMFLPLLGDSSPHVRREATAALGFLAVEDPFILEGLVEELRRTDTSEDRRIAAANALGFAVAPESSRNGLLGLEKTQRRDPSPDRLDPGALMRQTAVAFIETLDDPSTEVRVACLQGLQQPLRSGPADLRERVQDILLRWLSDADATVRSMALDWLDDAFHAESGSSLPEDVLRTLLTLLLDPDSRVRPGAARYLANPRGVPLLMEVIDGGGDPRLCVEALHVLHRLEGVDSWSSVFNFLEKPDGSVRQVAVDLLSSMGEEKGIGIFRLSRTLESRGSEARRAAARILARYHASGSLKPRGLFALLHDKDEEVLSEAAAALSFSGNLDAEVFDSRVLMLLDPGRPAAVRRAACRAARGLGPRAEMAVTRLVVLLERDPWDGQATAAEALGSIGAPARAGVPALLAAVEADDVELTAEAVEALGKISPGDAIRPAVRVLGHESGRVRDAAQTVLWSNGSLAAAALPELRRLAAQENDLDLATRATTLVGRLEASVTERR